MTAGWVMVVVIVPPSAEPRRSVERAADVDDRVRNRDHSAIFAEQPGRFRIFLPDKRGPA